MKKYSHIKKKIRGWKRRIKQIDKWGIDIQEPDLEWFAKPSTRDVYRRCTISPFYNADKKHPPMWFYKLLIAKFITAYDRWKQAFDELGIPYDLQLWIYDPSFIRSEIVCWKVQELNQLMKFIWESDLIKSFPYDTFKSNTYNLNDFDWVLADEEHVHFESDFEDADFSADDLLSDGYVKKVQNKDEMYYAKRLGDMWIGRRKTIP
jgi:hypothetical protein